MKVAYRNHKNNARKRGIAFEFDFDDWCRWWEEQLGPDWMKLRGCKKGQYVMARFRDLGPYKRGNVKCILSSKNHAEYNVYRKPQVRGSTWLADEKVISIFLDERPYARIASEFGVSKHKIQCIKRRIYYRRVTDKLGR